MSGTQLIEINGQPATDDEYLALLFELYKIVQAAPTKEAAMQALFSLLDEPTKEREMETRRVLGQF